MATDKAFAQRVVDQLPSLEISARPMFGEFGIYCRGKIFGLLCDNTLFVKITKPGELFAPDQDRGAPYPKASPYFRISDAQLDDDEWLTTLVSITFEALPEPKPKRPKKSLATGSPDYAR